MSFQSQILPGQRLHLNEGPIDLIIQAWGAPHDVADAYQAAQDRFEGLLATLVADLPALRSGVEQAVAGPVAQAMMAAVRPYRTGFITPMAAVAGAVADEILSAMTSKAALTRAYVNNGGDIALHLTPGQCLSAAIAARPGLPDRVTIRSEDDVRGIATSGWRGRSFSLGIADAVSVLAKTAAMADAAATVIANATDLPNHSAISRAPANSLKSDSDLGARLVTTHVATLPPADIDRALEQGMSCADLCQQQRLIAGAALFLQNSHRVLPPSTLQPCARSGFHLGLNIPVGSGEAAPPRPYPNTATEPNRD